jgi:RNA polymerase primary sigma factor
MAARLEITVDKLRFYLKSAQIPISLETPIGNDEDRCLLGDAIESNGETPEDRVTKDLLREQLLAVLDSLNPCERDLLCMRYGLDDRGIKTYEEIARILKLNQRKLHQIEANAINKLRRSSHSLKEYLC